MRVMTILGTRPEIIRLSRVIPLLDLHADHILVHTGQNFDHRLSRIFFDELGVREPDVRLDVDSTGTSKQIGQILEGCEKLFLDRNPSRVLILGDTNSGLAAYMAKRVGIPVYHMEAGNRCYDDRVPEEVNRRVIDHCSTVLMPYTERSRDNLIREGIPSHRIQVTGNPIKEVIDAHADSVERSSALNSLGLQERAYILATMHRAENVDVEGRLRQVIEALGLLHAETGMPVVCSVHPRTRARIEQFGIDLAQLGVRFLEPFGFFDFVRLEKSAFCVLSDSGTVQEEACILGVPAVTLREVTERPETIDCGSNFLAGTEPAAILAAVRLVTASGREWQPPREYLATSVADTVCRIVLGYRSADPGELDWRARRRA